MMNISISVKTPFTAYAVLCRISLSLVAACSTATGFLITTRGNYAALLLPTTAVFLLACGASALNQFQERELDCRMARTQKRPLPAGVLSPPHALWLSFGLVLSGLLTRDRRRLESRLAETGMSFLAEHTAADREGERDGERWLALTFRRSHSKDSR